LDAHAGLKKVGWHDFAKSALPASTLAEYWFCPAKICNKMRQGSIETPQTVAGSQIHEEEAQEVVRKLGPLKKARIHSLFDAMTHSRRNLASALKSRQILANSEKNILFRCIVPETGYIGLPDIADCRNGKQPLLVEMKTTGKLPTEAWMDNRIQMGVYLIGLERLSFRPEYGIIEYRLRTDPSSRERFEIHLDNSLRQTIQETTDAVQDILSGKEPVPCNNPRKCMSCAYGSSCSWSMSSALV
jgi:CRISPR/Cas system-associated exonuclease Cas4 (RecB family)